jgi:hypothetical protein
MSYTIADILSNMGNPRRKVFVSYHHDNDQWYYDEFSRYFSSEYEIIQDRSLDRAVDSENPEYVMRRIRENYITGTSASIVLCGVDTPKRKYVDWEIKATLDKVHGLVGIMLPNIMTESGKYVVPGRFHDNVQSGYAIYTAWASLTNNPRALATLIEEANSLSYSLIDNSRAMKQRNG